MELPAELFRELTTTQKVLKLLWLILLEIILVPFTIFVAISIVLCILFLPNTI